MVKYTERLPAVRVSKEQIKKLKKIKNKTLSEIIRELIDKMYD